MLLNNNSLIMQWNRDENGNPMSWHIPLETQQISPTHGVIQLVQVPDQHQRIKIVPKKIFNLQKYLMLRILLQTVFMLIMGLGLSVSMRVNMGRWSKSITMVVG